MLKNNPVMKKLVETGEERIGKIAQGSVAERRARTCPAALRRPFAAQAPPAMRFAR